MPRHKVVASQNVSRMCFVCGTQNQSGLNAHFYELASGELAGVFTPSEEHQGYPGRLHGGLAATILDETIGRAISISDPGVWGVTVELNIQFRKPVPMDAEVTAVGRIVSDSRRLFEGVGEILAPDGTVAVQARGKYLRMPIERISEGDFGTEEWFPDRRPLPASIEV